MKNIVSFICTFHIFFAVGMQQEKVRSIFENSSNYETYRAIFTKIVDSDQAQKLANFASIETLVLNMKENKLEQVENYVKQIKKEIPLVYIPHYSLDVKPMDQAAQKNHFFGLKLSNFSSCQLLDAINSLPWIDTEDRQKWTKSYTYILRAEWEKSEKKLSRLSLEHIDSKYLLHYLKKDGCPKRLLENAVRFFEQYGVQKRFPAYNYVIEYAFKRYPWYAAQYLIKFALKVDKKLAQKKVALAIVKAYKMLHIVEHDQKLVQSIINDQQALELFSCYGLNLFNSLNLEKQMNFELPTKDAKIEYIKQCYKVLLRARATRNAKPLEAFILDMQKWHDIYQDIAKMHRFGYDVKMCCEELIIKLTTQKFFDPMNQKLCPIFFENLLKDIKEVRESENEQALSSLEYLHNQMKSYAGGIGAGVCFSTLFPSILFIGSKNFYKEENVLSIDFLSFATLIGFFSAAAIATTVYFLDEYNKDNNASEKITLQKQISYIEGHLQGQLGENGQKIELQKEKYGATQKRASSIILGCLGFSIPALFGLEIIANKYDFIQPAITLIDFTIIPTLSYYLGKWLQGNDDQVNNAEKLIKNSFKCGVVAGFDARTKALEKIEKSQEEIIAIKAEESNESLPQIKQGLFKTLFGAVVTSAKSFCSNLAQRLQKIKIRHTSHEATVDTSYFA